MASTEQEKSLLTSYRSLMQDVISGKPSPFLQGNGVDPELTRLADSARNGTLPNAPSPMGDSVYIQALNAGASPRQALEAAMSATEAAVTQQLQREALTKAKAQAPNVAARTVISQNPGVIFGGAPTGMEESAVTSAFGVSSRDLKAALVKEVPPPPPPVEINRGTTSGGPLAAFIDNTLAGDHGSHRTGEKPGWVQRDYNSQLIPSLRTSPQLSQGYLAEDPSLATSAPPDITPELIAQMMKEATPPAQPEMTYSDVPQYMVAPDEPAAIAGPSLLNRMIASLTGTGVSGEPLGHDWFTKPDAPSDEWSYSDPGAVDQMRVNAGIFDTPRYYEHSSWEGAPPIVKKPFKSLTRPNPLYTPPSDLPVEETDDTAEAILGLVGTPTEAVAPTEATTEVTTVVAADGDGEPVTVATQQAKADALPVESYIRGEVNAPIYGVHGLSFDQQYELMSQKALGNRWYNPRVQQYARAQRDVVFGRFVLQKLMASFDGAVYSPTGADLKRGSIGTEGQEYYADFVFRGYTQKGWSDPAVMQSSWNNLVLASRPSYTATDPLGRRYAAVAGIHEYQVAAAKAKAGLNGYGPMGQMKLNAFHRLLDEFNQAVHLGGETRGLAAFLADIKGGVWDPGYTKPGTPAVSPAPSLSVGTLMDEDRY